MELLTYIIVAFVLMTGKATTPLPAPDASLPVKEVFAGTTPCGQLIRPLYQIAVREDCSLVEWTLTLQRDAVTQQPASFRLVGYSHYTLPDNNYSQPGTKREAAGKWSIEKGTGDFGGSVIYLLTPGKSGPPLRFVKLSDDLLHLLDEQGHYMRGDPFQSYTLNRITK